ncbi:hypothetical protein QBC35DRAFT_530904 [Podospora australis]|uniref:Phytanoyl-CoA dioxygenase n=1 Tax=Podospora australis TaxID=1536484 RepID=A0AAN6X0K4_9PEZI|nr:hypothetical protein QBC35DRAFT_530904 [Podospora australis]
MSKEYPNLLHDLETQGFTIIPSFLSPSELSVLRTSASALANLARGGHWDHVRTVGKQFPPWNPSDVFTRGIWGVQHLLHPSLSSLALDPTPFTRLYFSLRLLSLSKILLHVPEEEEDDESLVMELFNMLITPPTPFSLRWHRDDIPESLGPEEELARLKEESYSRHAQWNLPLYEDDSLIVVPGSHRRARTEAEREADPYEENMPGQKVVKLQPGDLIFYDNNILHRGVYQPDRERLTLHGSVGHKDGSRSRARNVLQHAVGEWVGSCDFSCLGGEETKERKVAEGMRERLVEMGRGVVGDVGYSLDG